MSVLAIVLAVLLGVSFAGAGVAKLAGLAVMREDAKRLGLSYQVFRVVGVLEVCGAAGLIGGLAFAPLAVAAATGLVGLAVGAVVCHVRAGDPVVKPIAAALVGLLTAVAGVLSATQ
jgi:uncharacterized membrane protein YphA (DoxX/SURF4 family)